MSNYGFILSNKKYVKHLLLDGYSIGDLKMDGMYIRVGIDENGYAISWMSEEDKKILGLVDYKEELNKSAAILKEAIESKNFEDFMYPTDEIYDLDTNNKLQILNHQTLSDISFCVMDEENEIENMPFIIGVVDIKEKKYRKVRLSDFERTMEELKMVHFVRKMDCIKVEVINRL